PAESSSLTCAATTGTLFSSRTMPLQSAESAVRARSAAKTPFKISITASERANRMQTPSLTDLTMIKLHFMDCGCGMNRSKPTRYGILFLWFGAICLAMAGCSSGDSGGPGTLSLSLSSSMALAPQDGTPARITATVSGNSGAVSFSVGGLPSGTVSNVAQQSGASGGAIALISSPNTPAGTYTLRVTATDGFGSSASQNLTLVVAVAGMVGATVDQTQGVNGKLQQFMSTSFQPAEWDYQFFQNHPGLEPSQLNMLGPQHIRIQGQSQAIPMKANSNPQQASDWDFTMLDALVHPVLAAADHS